MFNEPKAPTTQNWVGFMAMSHAQFRFLFGCSNLQTCEMRWILACMFVGVWSMVENWHVDERKLKWKRTMMWWHVCTDSFLKNKLKLDWPSKQDETFQSPSHSLPGRHSSGEGCFRETPGGDLLMSIDDIQQHDWNRHAEDCNPWLRVDRALWLSCLTCHPLPWPFLKHMPV